MIDDMMKHYSLTATELLAALVLGSVTAKHDLHPDLQELLDRARVEQSRTAKNVQYRLWMRTGHPNVNFEPTKEEA